MPRRKERQTRRRKWTLLELTLTMILISVTLFTTVVVISDTMAAKTPQQDLVIRAQDGKRIAFTNGDFHRGQPVYGEQIVGVSGHIWYRCYFPSAPEDGTVYNGTVDFGSIQGVPPCIP